MSTSGSPDATTAAAASGSAQRLNSARGPTLPRSWIAPPMATIRPMRFAASGFSRTSRARLVSGPSASTSTVPAGSLSRRSASHSTAGRVSGSWPGCGSATPPMPSVPCRLSGSGPGRDRGAAAPVKTGISSRPAKASSRPALRVVVSMPMLPATVVIPAIENSGETSARRMPMASSIPGSVSMTTRRGFAWGMMGVETLL